MKKLRACLVAALLMAGHWGAGQHPADEPKAPGVALKAAWLLDVQTGKLLPHPVVLIQEGKIVSIGSNAPVPPGYRLLDVGPATLLPGLMDCHTHLLHHNDEAYPTDLAEVSGRSLALRALMGSVLAQGMLQAGFTTVRDLGNSGRGGDVALRNAINLGYVVGPRMLVSTRALAPLGGQFGRLMPGAAALVQEEYAEFSGVEEARKAVRRAVYEGATCIKVIANDMNQYVSTEELRTIVEEAHRVNLKVAAHATGGKAIGACIAAGVDSIEHGYDLTDAELKQMAAKHIYLVPTDEPNIADQQQRLARAFKAGVPIAAGSDWYTNRQPGGQPAGGENPLLLRGRSSKSIFKAYVQAGLTPLQALQTGTVNAGKLLSFLNPYGQRVTPGVLEAGRPADIIAVQGDVRKDIAVLDNIGFVMKEGQVFFDVYSPAAK
jgi:imidazolonepropionase-like amidohydrolase